MAVLSDLIAFNFQRQWDMKQQLWNVVLHTIWEESQIKLGFYRKLDKNNHIVSSALTKTQHTFNYSLIFRALLE